MNPVKILVVSVREAITEGLKRTLPMPGFVDVIVARPGASFLSAVETAYPDIAVIDYAPRRDTAADLEIELLKAIRPDMKIVPIGRRVLDSPAQVLRRVRAETGALATCA